MTRPLALLLATAALCAAHAGLARAADKPALVADGTLSLCTDASFPPMEYFAKPGDAMPVGFDIDVGAALARHWAVALKVLPTDFTGLLPALAAGRCSMVISGIFYTDERAKSFAAVPYLKTAVVALARADATTITDPKDLSGKVVAVEAGTSYVKILDALNATLAAAGKPPVQVQTYPKQTDAIQQVLVGRATATLTQDTEAGYRDLQAPGQFKTIYTYGDSERFAIYLKQDDAARGAVRDAIAALTTDGSLPALLAKWKLPAGNLIAAAP